MPLPLKEFVHQVLLERRRNVVFYDAIRAGWADYLSQENRGRWRRRATGANIIWEGAVDYAIRNFLDDPQVFVLPHDDTVSFIIEDAVLLRIKRADHSLKSSNYPTETALLFDDHEADLFGYQGLQRVEVCYVLNQFLTGIDWIGIAANNNGVHLWEIELKGAEAKTENVVTPFKSGTPAQESNIKGLARLRKSTGEADNENKDGD